MDRPWFTVYVRVDPASRADLMAALGIAGQARAFRRHVERARRRASEVSDELQNTLLYVSELWEKGARCHGRSA